MKRKERRGSSAMSIDSLLNPLSVSAEQQPITPPAAKVAKPTASMATESSQLYGRPHIPSIRDAVTQQTIPGFPLPPLPHVLPSYVNSSQEKTPPEDYANKPPVLAQSEACGQPISSSPANPALDSSSAAAPIARPGNSPGDTPSHSTKPDMGYGTPSSTQLSKAPESREQGPRAVKTGGFLPGPPIPYGGTHEVGKLPPVKRGEIFLWKPFANPNEVESPYKFLQTPSGPRLVNTAEPDKAKDKAKDTRSGFSGFFGKDGFVQARWPASRQELGRLSSKPSPFHGLEPGVRRGPGPFRPTNPVPAHFLNLADARPWEPLGYPHLIDHSRFDGNADLTSFRACDAIFTVLYNYNPRFCRLFFAQSPQSLEFRVIDRRFGRHDPESHLGLPTWFITRYGDQIRIEYFPKNQKKESRGTVGIMYERMLSGRYIPRRLKDEGSGAETLNDVERMEEWGSWIGKEALLEELYSRKPHFKVEIWVNGKMSHPDYPNEDKGEGGRQKERGVHEYDQPYDPGAGGGPGDTETLPPTDAELEDINDMMGSLWSDEP
ncbi:hypothetical protein B0H63DRAFT_1769 [Podospora didyma]|uniref:Uncharacterized protein n=1 Tax=Podospora didyma TaxID=330526 RepID=A0AAE0P3Q5_9PEZI|nr:hypothetical protein B0H63DRAFT_1769 [Podospora didyma]